MAKGLIQTGEARNVLLLTAETYSKFMHGDDRSTHSIFGDAAAATLVSDGDAAPNAIGPFSFGIDAKGRRTSFIPAGGMRKAITPGNLAPEDALYMNGPEIFTFTPKIVLASVKDVLARAGKSMDDVDLLIFHQANRYMLDHARR